MQQVTQEQGTAFVCADQTYYQRTMDPNGFMTTGAGMPGAGQQQQAGGGGMGNIAAFMPMMQQMSSFFETQMRERAAAARCTAHTRSKR